jgi:ATP adenylyltransferase
VHRLPELGDDQEEIEFALGSIFMNLLDLVIATVRNDPDHPVGSPSFNVLLSLEHMHIIPRRQENHELKVTKDKMSINALGFAGMLLVKSDEELEAVKIENILDILAGVGVPKYDVGEQVTVAQDIEEHT